MESSPTHKKRSRSESTDEADSTDHGAPIHKKSKLEDGNPHLGGIKRAASVSATRFVAPPTDSNLPAEVQQQARDLLAYIEVDNPNLFLAALKTAFESINQTAAGRTDPAFSRTYAALKYVSNVAGHYMMRSVTEEDGTSHEIWRYLCGRLSTVSADLKRSSELSVLACNMLFTAFQEELHWPIEFVQAFLEDSFGRRQWVDDESCRGFVCNVLSVAPKDRATEEFLSDDDYTKPTSISNHSNNLPNITNNCKRADFRERYTDPLLRDRVADYTSQIVDFHLATLNSQQELFPSPNASASESVKNLVRTMSLLTPYPSVRRAASNCLDNWFSNPQTARYAKDLLRRMVVNTVDPSESDVEVARLVLLYKHAITYNSMYFHDQLARLASHNVVFRVNMLRDLILEQLVKEVNGQGTGSKVIGKLFEAVMRVDGEADLAAVIHDVALLPTFAPHLKMLIPILLSYYPPSGRELNIFRLCHSLSSRCMQLETAGVGPESALEWSAHVADTLMAVMIDSVPKITYEQPGNTSSNVVTEREEAFKSFVQNGASVLLASIEWCINIVSSYLGPTSSHHLPSILRKLLLLERLDTYYLGSKPLSEVQYSSLSRVLRSIPISEHMLVLLASSGTSSAILESDRIEIITQLVWQALSNGFDLVPSITQPATLEAILRLCSFAPATQLDSGEVSQQRAGLPIDSVHWAHRDRVWKACTLLTVCAASRPSTAGALIWTSIPSCRLLMEVLITHTLTEDASTLSEIRKHSLQESQLLPYLHKAMPAEKMSEFDLILFDPSTSYCLPDTVAISQLRELDANFKLSSQLISCRNPDFLGDLLKKHDLNSAVWLSHLASSDPSILAQLPVQATNILFLASNTSYTSSRLLTLPPVFINPMLTETLSADLSNSISTACSVLQFFLSHISSQTPQIRLAAHKSLSKLLASNTPNGPSSEVSWLSSVSKITYFKALKELIHDSIIDSLKVETEATITESLFEYLLSENGFQTEEITLIVLKLLASMANSWERAELISSSPTILEIARQSMSSLLPTSGLFPSVSFATITPKEIIDALLSIRGESSDDMIRDLTSSISVLKSKLVPSSSTNQILMDVDTTVDASSGLSSRKEINKLLSRWQTKPKTSTDLPPVHPKTTSNVTRPTSVETIFAMASSSDLKKHSQFSETLEDATLHLRSDDAPLQLELISNLNQALSKLISQDYGAKTDIGLGEENGHLPRWRDWLHKESESASNKLQPISFSLVQEISILEPLCHFRASASPYSTNTAPSSQALQSQLNTLVPSSSNKMHLFQPSWVVRPASSANTRLVWSSEEVRGYCVRIFAALCDLDHEISPSDRNAISSVDHTAYWLFHLAALDDFAPLLPLIFDKSSSDPPSALKVKFKMLGLIQRDASWETKRRCVEYFLGSSHPNASATACNLDRLEISLFLNFLERHMQDENGKSWSDHISSLSATSSSSLREKEVTVLVLNKAQLCLLVDAVMHELTHARTSGTSGFYPADEACDVAQLLSRRGNLLLSSCNTTSSAITREQRVIWLIEHLSQTPNAHNMSAMRWVEDVLQATLLSSTSWTFRPEQLIQGSNTSLRQRASSSTASEDITLWPKSAATETELPLSASEACESLLSQIYFEYPWQIFGVVKHFPNRVSSTDTQSKLDYAIHKLLKRLNAPTALPYAQDTAHNPLSTLPTAVRRENTATLEILRTYALSHPAFLIKFIPTMTAMLSGRTQVGMTLFLEQNSLELFDGILSIVSMLTPLVFHDSFAKPHLRLFLDAYFKALQMVCEGNTSKRPEKIFLTPLPSMAKDGANHSSTSATVALTPGSEAFLPLVTHFASFLGLYCSEALVLDDIFDSISPSLGTLSATFKMFPSVARIGDVIQSVTDKRQIVAPPPHLSQDSAQSIKLLLSSSKNLEEMIRNSSTQLDALYDAIHRLESMSNSPDTASMIRFFIHDVHPFMNWSPLLLTSKRNLPPTSPINAHTIERIRRAAICVAANYLHHYPREGEKTISVFLSCLLSPITDVKNDAIPYAKSVVLHSVSTQQQSELMMALFIAGKAGLNPLRDIISLYADIL